MCVCVCVCARARVLMVKCWRVCTLQAAQAVEAAEAAGAAKAAEEEAAKKVRMQSMSQIFHVWKCVPLVMFWRACTS